MFWLMKMCRNGFRSFDLALLLVFGITCASAGSLGHKDLKFDVLELGTQSYTNVTITTKAPTYILMVHAGGMETVKVADLTVEEREKLGYIAPKPKTNAVAGWTKAQVSKINQKEMKEVSRKLQAQVAPALKNPRTIPPLVIWAFAGLAIFTWFFFSYCAMLICQKTGNEPGPLIWVPILQLVPMVRAAGMAPIWVVVWILPFVNLVAQIVWSFKIAEAREKSALAAICLIFPLTSPFAFMYLAFSSGKAPKPERPKAPEIMTLEAA